MLELLFVDTFSRDATILIACIDNLKGFPESIQTIFPKTEIQTCIVHQIRNSMRYIPHKDCKEFLRDLKDVYKAPNKGVAKNALIDFSQKWDKKTLLSLNHGSQIGRSSVHILSIQQKNKNTPDIIHNDSFLIGKYAVIYSQTDDFSTVRLLNSSKEMLPTAIIGN